MSDAESDEESKARRDTLFSPAHAARAREPSPQTQSAQARVAAALFQTPRAPVKIGRYEVVRELGSGGMGRVFLAHDQHLDRPVAIKLIRDDRAGDEARARLRREAQAMARLSHPNVVTVHEVGDHGDQLFVAMEYVKGQDMRGWLAATPRRWRAVLKMFIQAGEGLAAAHDAGIVHRDFKPDNALVGEDGRVRVADFGLAHAIERPPAELAGLDGSAPRDGAPASTPLDAPLTRTGGILGTPGYMAPEQFSCARADARTDQFGYCVALWEALYDQRPFRASTIAALARAVLDGALTEPPADRGVPPWVREVLTRGLSPSPSTRWPSMRALLDALRRGSELQREVLSRLPRPRYATNDGVHLAYVTVGEGQPDIVLINGWVMSMRSMFDHQRPAAAVATLSQRGRVIMFDKRGTGLSDRVKELPSHGQRVEDLRVVLDEAGSRDALLLGVSEGCALAVLFATKHPERTRGLMLCGGFARLTQAPGYPWAYSEADIERLRRYIRQRWGDGRSVRALCPSRLDEPAFNDWICALEREGASPGAALDLLDMNAAIDLRPELPAVAVPTTILTARADRMTRPEAGRFLAREIPGARLVTVEGDDHTLLFEHHDVLADELERLAARAVAPLE